MKEIERKFDISSFWIDNNLFSLDSDCLDDSRFHFLDGIGYDDLEFYFLESLGLDDIEYQKAKFFYSEDLIKYNNSKVCCYGN